MEILGLWFTYGLDSHPLIESVNAFRKTFPLGKVCISDDPKNSISQTIRADISPDIYAKRNWNSGGNLNGWPSVRGILEFQIEAQNRFPDSLGAIKIDSDTLVLGNNWLDPGKALIGLDCGSERLFSGMCRYLRKDVPNTILDYLDSRTNWSTASVPEDITIGGLTTLLFGKECVSLEWYDHALTYNFKNSEVNNRFAELVTFGSRKDIKSNCPESKRKLMRIAMMDYKKLHNKL